MPVSKYEFITVQAIPANLSEVLDKNSEQQRGVRAEMALALNAPALRDALELAVSHIDWCWDVIEGNTRLKRQGSGNIHDQLKAVLDLLETK